MRKLIVLAAFASIFLVSCSDRPSKKAVAERVDAIVSRIKGADSHASEHIESRMYHFLDVDGDGTSDAVSFFTVEGFDGGNNYQFYMAVLLNKKGGLTELGTVQVGGKGVRGVNFDEVSLSQGAIELKTTEYGPDDPMCCPSRPGAARFAVSGGIREIVVEL